MSIESVWPLQRLRDLQAELGGHGLAVVADRRRVLGDRELAGGGHGAGRGELDRTDLLGAVERDRLDRTDLLPGLRVRPGQRHGERVARGAGDRLGAAAELADEGLELDGRDGVGGIDERGVAARVTGDDVRAAADGVGEVVAVAAEHEVVAVAAEQRVLAFAAVERDRQRGPLPEDAGRGQAVVAEAADQIDARRSADARGRCRRRCPCRPGPPSRPPEAE